MVDSRSRWTDSYINFQTKKYVFVFKLEGSEEMSLFELIIVTIRRIMQFQFLHKFLTK